MDSLTVVILDRAYKHGISEESILSCLYNAKGGKLLDDPPPKELLAGFDHEGREIELVVIEDERGLVVIHAMKLRKQFYYLLGGSYGI